MEQRPHGSAGWPSKDVADYRGKQLRWFDRRPVPFAVIGVIAAGVWFAAFFIAISGNWYLECSTGESLITGIDCFQALPGSARTDSPLAGWFGFAGLFWTLIGATFVFIVCAIAAGRQDRGGGSKTGASALPVG